MNDACNVPVIKHTKKVTGSRPNVPVNKATVGTMNTQKFTAIDPTSTPASTYIKKVK